MTTSAWSLTNPRDPAQRCPAAPGTGGSVDARLREAYAHDDFDRLVGFRALDSGTEQGGADYRLDPLDRSGTW